MEKSESMCSDLNLIKEVESLRLKQKLLVSTLKRESLLKKDEAFVELNAKLDMIIKIFKDASEGENKEEEGSAIEEKLNNIVEKLAIIDEISEKLDVLTKRVSELDSKPSSPSSSNIPPAPNFAADNSLEKKDETNSEGEKGLPPPIADVEEKK
ncbi:MAG: hypothetical protein ACOCXG_01770 [Nanoarchaeota archaeon]